MHFFVGLRWTWDRKLSSGWILSGQLNSALTGLMSLTFMATHLLQFPLAVIEQYCLFIFTCFKSWDQKLSSGLLLKFMFTHLFQFRLAVTEQSWLFTLGNCRPWNLAVSRHLVPKIDIFASSTGEFNIITLDHMKKLKNVLSLETPDTLTTIDLAGSQGLEGMRIDTVRPQKIIPLWSRCDRVHMCPELIIYC